MNSVTTFLTDSIVMQELAFIGDALAHAAFPGVVIAFLLKLPLELGGALPRFYLSI